MMGDCKPMKQWQLRGELLRRIKARFDLEGIEIPFPHQTVYWGVDQPSLTIQEKISSKNTKKYISGDAAKYVLTYICLFYRPRIYLLAYICFI